MIKQKNKSLLPLLMFSLITLFFSLKGQTANIQHTINLKNISPKERKVLLKKFPNIKKSSLSQLDQILRFLMRTGKYQSAEAQIRGKTIQIIAPLKRIIDKIEIIGNRQIPSENFQTLTRPYIGQYFNRSQFIEIGNSIKRMYSKNGFFNSTIEVNFKKQGTSLLTSQFKISENAACYINNIIINSRNIDLNKSLQIVLEEYKQKIVTNNLKKLIQEKITNYLNKKNYFRSELILQDTIFNENKTLATINFQIKNPYQYHIFIEGNDSSYFTEQTLLRHLSESSIGKSSKPPYLYAREFIKNKYLQKGFAKAEASSTEESQEESFSKNISINVSSSNRVKIKKIHLTGKFSKKKKYYINFIKNNSSELIKSNYFYNKDFSTGKKNLITELRNQGFLNANISSSSEKFTDNNQSIEIFIDLQEGPLTKIQDVVFIGNNSFDKDFLTKIINISPDEPLILKLVEDSIQKLTQFYFEKGYLEFRIKNTEKDSTTKIVSYNSDNTKAKIQYFLEEGPSIKVKNIKIIGNNLTKDYVILRNLSFTKNDTLTQTLINESRSQLEKTGLFSRVEIDTLEKNTSQAKRIVQISVSEKNPGVFQLGAGLTNERTLTLRGYLGVGYNNILGTARSTSLRLEVQNNIADINFLEKKAIASYVEPFLFGNLFGHNTLGRFNLSFTQDIFEISESLNQVSILENAELELRSETKISSYILFLWKIYSLSLQKTFEKDGKTGDSSSVIAKIGPSIEFDYRDNTFFPRTGSFSRISIDYSDPAFGSSSTIHFLKAAARTTVYLPVLNTVWANSIRGGYIKNLSSNSGSGVPAVEAFFLGSRSTVRGFEAIAERFPDNGDLGVAEITDFFITNESHFALFKSEFRIPLFSSLGATVFYDGGLVQVSGINLQDAYRDSVGVGLQFITPVGPVNFEIGYKLDRNTIKNESPFEFHFSIGSF